MVCPTEEYELVIWELCPLAMVDGLRIEWITPLDTID